ncbi:Uncharacterised protein [Campylobacter hyointestinalis subsp. hyointestinalis]|uniref:Uncharacterized protein n=1 Tax=Campylobacter hyointestinalis subsp. hyointestinalis TaxID=91352 RepID=A0A0S4SPA6_CAMHY|nr:hypothetical protein [Campylobacter hyointestinalis]CUU88274.1 Uncharacterised protein [Campylobacter hyointestinalis subsp. hyointestinalis]
MNKSYNKFERAYEIMTELTKAPLPLEPTELAMINDRELGFLKSNIRLMAEYLGLLGCQVWHDDEVVWQIHEEEQRRAQK